MDQGEIKTMEEIYPHCRSHFSDGAWRDLVLSLGGKREPERIAEAMASRALNAGLPGFLADLSRVESLIDRAKSSRLCPEAEVDRITVNPTLDLVRLSWKNLPSLLQTGTRSEQGDGPEQGDEFVVVFRHPKTGAVVCRAAADQDLLALKILAEDFTSRQAAAQGGVPVTVVDSALGRAVQEGLLLAPVSRIRRDTTIFSQAGEVKEEWSAAPVFTLQWHITQACDLHCRHCYDRSERSSMALSRAIGILDDLHDFCKDRNVKGQVSFTGGNPLLYPHFTGLYGAASDRGFALAILGNPAPRGQIREIASIESPAYYQVSLEGLQEHNDHIRGSGHYDRVMGFLDTLRDLGIYSMVMLTLTGENMAQVLPLAEALRGRTDLFTFNRLSLVGEGANLGLPSKEEYALFLQDYVRCARDNPVIGFKDNLINIVLRKRGEDLFGGCTGHGCGAAFNFMSVLPDGEVHACRKFPSPIGNVLEQGIAGVYGSPAAERYRSGSRSCASCAIRPICGGCLAVSYSLGHDIFQTRDPFCFIEP
jgi:selenobiotic family peptide radical SAM maturase